jgi:hypothetical protein
MKPPRPLPHPRRPLGQEHPLVAAQSPAEPDRQPARDALGRPAGQPAPLPRLPAQRTAAAALPPARPRPRPSTPRRLADMGHALTPEAVRPPRPHPANAPRRHPCRHPPRPLQWSTRSAQQQDPSDQPPRLRLPLRRPPDRARLPLLRRHHDPAPPVNFTPKPDEAPERPRGEMATPGLEPRTYVDLAAAYADERARRATRRGGLSTWCTGSPTPAPRWRTYHHTSTSRSETASGSGRRDGGTIGHSTAFQCPNPRQQPRFANIVLVTKTLVLVTKTLAKPPTCRSFAAVRGIPVHD